MNRGVYESVKEGFENLDEAAGNLGSYTWY